MFYYQVKFLTSGTSMFVNTCFHSLHLLFNFTQFLLLFFPPSLVHHRPTCLNLNYFCVILTSSFKLPNQFFSKFLLLAL